MSRSASIVKRSAGGPSVQRELSRACSEHQQGDAKINRGQLVYPPRKGSPFTKTCRGIATTIVQAIPADANGVSRPSIHPARRRARPPAVSTSSAAFTGAPERAPPARIVQFDEVIEPAPPESASLKAGKGMPRSASSIRAASVRSPPLHEPSLRRTSSRWRRTLLPPHRGARRTLRKRRQAARPIAPARRRGPRRRRC